MDEKQIAFIICVNDEEEYAECRHYLERLYVPEGYSTDIISIREAPSMTAGYNAGMRSSDAKYKVYMHQDVFIKNVNFLPDILEIFSCDKQIGMLGVIGKKGWGTTALEMSRWDVGSVIYCCQVKNWIFQDKKCYTEVSSVDGLLMATQYDIPWREDVFDGWDFYDFSQCMEFKKRRYKVVVPQQEEIWCCHDGLCSNLASYFDYYEKFVKEYGGTEGIFNERSDKELFLCKINKEYAQNIILLKREIEKLFDVGEKARLRNFFKNMDFRGNSHLREYEAIVCIDQIEEQQQSDLRLWNTGMSISQLLMKLRTLKYALKRVEYRTDDVEKIDIWGNYSGFAVKIVCDYFVTDRDMIYKKLKLSR